MRNGALNRSLCIPTKPACSMLSPRLVGYFDRLLYTVATMSYPNHGSEWTSISTSEMLASSTTRPLIGAPTSSVPEHPLSTQEEPVQSNRPIYHVGTGSTIRTQEGQPLRFEPGHAGTSYGFSQTGDMESKAPGMDPVSSVSSSIVQSTSFFSGAHHFTVHNPIMVANDRPEIERKMLKLLEKKAMADGTYDSAARHYTAPHCHPDTRVPLRERLESWLLDAGRIESLFWLYGPAGVGKSAIAQYIMEFCEQQGIPGAGLFLSRANKRDDPNRIIPSLAHQLALAYPSYRRLVSNILSADSTILEKRVPLQFRRLIDEPADALRIEASDVTPHPILLLLDGLDECNTYEAQCELIKILTSFASACKARRLPFVCIVTSRPEWQIVSTFDALGPASGVRREELRMDTPEARQDVSVVLRDGFQRITSKHSDAFSADVEWPARTDLQTIESAASGNMLFASLVVTFIDDDYPTTQLELCLKSLQGKLTSDERNPFDPLTALYRELLFSIPCTLLPTALLVLYTQLLVSENQDSYELSGGTPAQAIASFLFIEQATFYGSLKRLRSVLSVPLPADASYKCLVFSHTTFADYVKVAIQMGDFGLHEVDALTEIRIACIKWHHLVVGKGLDGDFSDVVPWAGKTLPDGIHSLLKIFLFKSWHDLLRRGNIGKLQEELKHFSFKDLPRDFCRSCGTDDDLMRLAHDLVIVDTTQSTTDTHIVRTVPLWPTDHQLIDKYVTLFGQWGVKVKPMEWNSHSSSMWDGVGLWFCSVEDSFDDAEAFSIVREISWRPTLAYFLLGHDQNTVLVIAYPREMDLRAYWKEAFEKIKTSRSADDPWPGDQEQSFLYSYLYGKLNSLYHNGGDGEPPQIDSHYSISCNVVSFVVDPWRGNPYSRLRVVADILSFTSGCKEIIHHLFRHMLGDIPHEINRIAQQVLACLVMLHPVYPGHVHLKDLERFMCVDHATINYALQWLYPVVFSWRPHSSAPNIVYLCLRLPVADVRLGTLEYLLWQHAGCKPWSCLEQETWVAVFSLWTQWCILYSTTGDHPFPSHFRKTAFPGNPWRALREIRTPEGCAAVATQLCDFPFYRLDQELLHGYKFREGFLEVAFRLSSDSAFAPLLRTQPICQVDHQLLEKWAKFGHDSELAILPIVSGLYPWHDKYRINAGLGS
ncbi:hypothetical protein D9756_010173 [Leucocoprinus leucothites]|uniref:Nephrocystin 3-like N-terminal domain-containing protein n=1 Tax=Leucocoprinus leucothites TaxID=201217 RepID=A0A8H5FTA5_9AGAR|nr:hypothetical protein D9756_010173 [Leucoagaricus leucothites]